jgi:serine/threonine-protein kinase
MTVWVWSPAARTLTPIDRGSSAQLNPYWTDDGERIVYYDMAAGALVSRRADGVGEIERLVAQFAGAFGEAADGTLLLTVQSEARTHVDIGLLPSTGEREVSRVLATQYNEAYPALSPDGRWLAYTSDESGRLEVYVRPFPDVDARRWQVSTDGGQFPKWAPDGGALYFLGPSQMLRAAVEAAPTFSWRPPEVLFEHGAYLMTAGLLPIGYALAADGQRFLFLKSAAAAGPSAAAAPELVVVQSWLDELERSAAE